MDSINFKTKSLVCLLAIIIILINQAVNSEAREANQQLFSNKIAVPNLIAFDLTPRSSSEILEAISPPERTIQKEIEVLIPVFDPNIPETEPEQERAGVWPELRRVDARHLAKEMKRELEATNEFGAVRIIPNLVAMDKIKDSKKERSITDVGVVGDLYVLGKINASNGAHVNVNIRVVSRDNVMWLNKDYKHDVSERFYHSRNKDKNPYNPLFEKAAADIAHVFKSKSPQYLKNLNLLGEVYFAYTMSDDYFEPFLEIHQNGRMELLRVPADDDLMYKRARKLRIHDQLFIDNMQQVHEDFYKKTQVSYKTWQTKALPVVQAMDGAKAEAIRRKTEIQAQRNKAKETAQKERERGQAKANKLKKYAEEDKRDIQRQIERKQERASDQMFWESITDTIGTMAQIKALEDAHSYYQNQVVINHMSKSQERLNTHSRVYEEMNKVRREANKITREAYDRADEIEEQAILYEERQLEEIEQDYKRALNAPIFSEHDFHRDTLISLGKSAHLDVEPHVVMVEDKEVKLAGSTAEQFNEWRKSLRRIYNETKTPDKNL